MFGVDMPSHPPRSEPFRKKEILEKREQELRHAIRHKVSEEKLIKAAEKVRTSQLKVFKGILEQFRYKDVQKNGSKPGAKAIREQERWQKLSIEEIIAMYESKCSLPLSNVCCNYPDK